MNNKQLKDQVYKALEVQPANAFKRVGKNLLRNTRDQDEFFRIRTDKNNADSLINIETRWREAFRMRSEASIMEEIETSLEMVPGSDHSVFFHPDKFDKFIKLIKSIQDVSDSFRIVNHVVVNRFLQLAYTSITSMTEDDATNYSLIVTGKAVHSNDMTGSHEISSREFHEIVSHAFLRAKLKPEDVGLGNVFKVLLSGIDKDNAVKVR